MMIKLEGVILVATRLLSKSLNGITGRDLIVTLMIRRAHVGKIIFVNHS